jgi:hypothetical protein
MPRYLPRSLGPAPAPPLPPLRAVLRVTESFNCEGRAFRKGDVVSVNDELVQRISEQYPWLFRPEIT